MVIYDESQKSPVFGTILWFILYIWTLWDWLIMTVKLVICLIYDKMHTVLILVFYAYWLYFCVCFEPKCFFLLHGMMVGNLDRLQVLLRSSQIDFAQVCNVWSFALDTVSTSSDKAKLNLSRAFAPNSSGAPSSTYLGSLTQMCQRFLSLNLSRYLL